VGAAALLQGPAQQQPGIKSQSCDAYCAFLCRMGILRGTQGNARGASAGTLDNAQHGNAGMHSRPA
jgi:hypothetical protein